MCGLQMRSPAVCAPYDNMTVRRSLIAVVRASRICERIADHPTIGSRTCLTPTAHDGRSHCVRSGHAPSASWEGLALSVCAQMQATVRSLTLMQYVSAAAGVEARVNSDTTTMVITAKR